MEELLSGNSCKQAIERVLHDLENAESNIEKLNHDLFVEVIKTSSFFHKNLEVPATLHDFAEYAKAYMKYQIVPPGTVLSREGDIPNNLSIVLKGAVIKFQPRRYDDIEREMQAKHPQAPKGGSIEEEMLDEDASKKKETPRYLRHTQATQKKTMLSKMGCYVMTLAKMGVGTSEFDKQKDVGPKTVGNVEEVRRYRRQRTKRGYNQSMNELGIQENQQEEEEESSRYEPEKPYLKRMGSIQPEEAGQKEEQNSLGELEEENENEGDETGKKKGKSKKRKMKIEDPTMTQEEIAFLEMVASAYPDIPFFLADVVRVRKSKTYGIGDYFGDSFYKDYRQKENSIVVTGSEEVHLLNLTREDYKSIMNQIFQHAEEKVEFFKELLPSFEDEIVRKFAYNFSDKQFKKNECIYYENDKAQELYLLRSGQVKLLKTCDFSSNQPSVNNQSNSKRPDKGELAVASIMTKQFFGEEILLKEARRLYTAVVVTSDTGAYFLEAHRYYGIKGNFVELLNTLKQQTKERFVWRQQRVLELIEQKKQMLAKASYGQQKATENEKSLNTTTVLLTSKAATKSMDTTKLTQLLDQAPNRQETINQLRGMILKANRVLVVESPRSNKKLELYKAKFSRKTNIMDKIGLEDKLIKLNTEESVKTHPDHASDNDFSGFNIRKELTEKKLSKLKLPAISTVHHLARDMVPPIKGIETARSPPMKEPDSNLILVSHIKQEKQPKSSVLDNLEMETGSASQRAKKLKLKELTGTPNLISPFASPRGKADDKQIFLAPRNLAFENREDHGHHINEIVNVHTSKVHKKSGLPNKWKKKIAALPKPDISDFQGIVGKKPEFKIKEK